ncbi:uncharacterized protein LOC142341721 [Convolutriloba macropyga]|uniref:uncharacterized protein LOC142341721 n=1 Tax=Convolutriloba macropyga TaxID=536237 RepID=UPI003F51FAAB
MSQDCKESTSWGEETQPSLKKDAVANPTEPPIDQHHVNPPPHFTQDDYEGPRWPPTFGTSGGNTNQGYVTDQPHNGNHRENAYVVGSNTDQQQTQQTNLNEHTAGLQQAGNANTQSVSWHQNFWDFMDTWNICIVTLICPPMTLFAVGFYGKQMKLWVAMFVSLVVFVVSVGVRQGILIGHNVDSISDASVNGGMRTIFYFCYVLALVAASARAILFAALRSQIRDAFRIEGNGCDDFGMACFCAQCALCQMMAELDWRRQLEGKKTIFTQGSS